MDNIITFSMLCFTSFFTLVDPLGTMPVFLSMTHGLDESERRQVARKACLVSFLVLAAFTLSGRYLFQFFGISTNGFRIVGGIIIFKIGYDMLQAQFTHIKLNDSEQKSYANDITITPLAIPMLCGPGAMANGIALMEDASDILSKMAVIVTMAVVFGLSYIILCASTRLLRFLGETGNNVIMRLMGLILMVIAVECFISGARPILTDILKSAAP